VIWFFGLKIRTKEIPLQIELHDPRFTDGEPFEVAAKGAEQVLKGLLATQTTLSHFRWAARGAWMSAEYHRTGEMPQGDDFIGTVLAKKLDYMEGSIERLLKELPVIADAASWNPKGL
jgi:hypothetical protein